MRVEAFSSGKNPAAQEANEDRVVVLPGRAYAVIDGVTDRSGARYDGRSSGQIAADMVQAALERVLSHSGGDPEPEALLSILTDEIASAYRKFGLFERARVQPNLRFGATLALFRLRGAFDEVLLVGDSGVRLDGSRVLQVEKPLDAITTSLRVAAWHAMARGGVDEATRDRIARQVVFYGAAQDIGLLDGALDRRALDGIAAHAAADCRARFAWVPPAVIDALLARGIVHGQFEHQNSPISPLGYSALDGFAIARRHVTVERLEAGATRCVELFSDGYFEKGETFGIAAWEAAADEVERVDPAKIGPYASVKGSRGCVRADDRSYVGVLPS